MTFHTHRFFLIVSLVTVDSLHFVFARLLFPHIAPSAAAMYVLAVATVELMAVNIIFFRTMPRLTWDRFWLFLAIGLLVGGSTYLDYEAMSYIDPGTAALLYQATIFFGIVLGILLLKESVSFPQLIGTVFAIVGVVSITFQPGDYIRIGTFLILISALMYALHSVIAKRYGSSIDFFDFFFFRLLFTTFILFVFCFAQQELIWPEAHTWFLLILVGTVDVLISRALYYLALRRLKVSLLSVSLTLSPVVAVIWAVVFFNAPLFAKQIIAGAAILAGVILALFPISTSRDKRALLKKAKFFAPEE